MPLAPGTGTAARSSIRLASRVCRRPRPPVRTACAAKRSTWRVSSRRGSSQYQPQLANIASRDAWARISAGAAGAASRSSAVPLRRAPAPRRPTPAARRTRWPRPRSGHVPPRRRCPALPRRASVARVDGAREPVERLAQRRLPAAVGGAAAVGPPSARRRGGRTSWCARRWCPRAAPAASMRRQPLAGCHRVDRRVVRRPTVSSRSRNRSRNGW